MSADPRVGPAYAGLLAAGCTFIFFATMMNTVTRGWPAWYRLAHSGVPANATVTAVVPGDHMTCYVEFMVGSRKYTSVDQVCHAQKGDVLAIRYDPANPSSATFRSPRAELRTQILACLIMSIIAGGVGFRQKQHSMMSAAQQ